MSLLIYAGAPVLYFLSITVLRSGRNRDQVYADSPNPRPPVRNLTAEPATP